MGRTIDLDLAVNALQQEMKLHPCGSGEWFVLSSCLGKLVDLPSAQPEPCEDAVSRTELLHIFEENCYPVHYDHNSIDVGMTLPGIVEVLNIATSVTPKRKTMICGACLYCDSEALYVTNPIRIQCRKTGNLHFTTDYCDCENENEKVRNMWEESDK